METTPSSVRKTSQSSSSSVSYKSKQDGPKSDRSALIDITNDSPITGLLAGNESTKASTPGSVSGEALLRGQVKNLLKKVEKDGNKIPVFATRNPIPNMSKLGFARSPMQLLAPTPNNTPQMVVPSDLGFLQPAPQIVSPVVPQSQSLIPCLINRALQFDDSPDKLDASSGILSKSSSLTCLESLDASSEISSSSSLTYQESIGSVSFNQKSVFESPNSDNSSDWSIKANAGTEKEESDGSDGFKIKKKVEDLDELCEGMRKMKVEFEGKHVRFVYNSDGEMEGEEAERIENRAEAVLKGLPVPEGKHLSFHEEEEED
ncbi:hypothetical protein LUZ60_014246 [Juncus effusus]|nr:hypothetical protein LUZ60_014246 [Juncus effusus]